MLEHLEGTIERITYQNEETGYVIAKLEPKGDPQLKRRRSSPSQRFWGQNKSALNLVTIVGEMASVNPGENVTLEGYWTTHPEYGHQFKIESYKIVHPSTVEGLRKYLGSGLIKGIGPVTASRIVDHFGLETLEVIENDPERLSETPGVGEKRVKMIGKAWQEQRKVKDVMLFLQSHDVSTGYATKIYKQYGDNAINVVKNNPYQLERDIWGIGFLTADKIARSIGIENDSIERIKAGIRYALNKLSEEGHVYAPSLELVDKAVEFLEVRAELVSEALGVMEQDKEIVVEGGRVFLPPLYYAEVGIANNLKRLMLSPLFGRNFDAQKEIEHIEKRSSIRFSKKQTVAIQTSLTDKVMVLTGGPGTGKTTITRGIIDVFESNGLRVMLCAPTGRAAKRLSEATGRRAQTVHRLLGFKPGEGAFQKDRENLLDADVLIVDEMSMVDAPLMNSLVRALPHQARLILVGDADQLPSVGAGNVLRDIIDSGEIPIVELYEIFRQERGSLIVTNAHKINSGEYPYINNKDSRDFFFVEEEDTESTPGIIEDLCKRRIPKRTGLDPIDDIQVICPMYKGETGVINLNSRLQEALNPIPEMPKKPVDALRIRRGNTEYRVKDKVMQMRNNYSKMVFNGDIGAIKTINLEDQSLSVMFDRLVEYDFRELDELILAYAVSVHKYQGSECRAMVMPLTTQHYMMLQRNLLYTAVTRARDMVVLVGTKKALWIAIKNDKVAERYTSLDERLKEQ